MNTEVLLIPLLTALMQAIKQVPWLQPEGHHWILPFIALVLGVAGTMAYLGVVDSATAVTGIIYGLAAVGLYDAAIDPVKKLTITKNMKNGGD